MIVRKEGDQGQNGAVDLDIPTGWLQQRVQGDRRLLLGLKIDAPKYFVAIPL